MKTHSDISIGLAGLLFIVLGSAALIFLHAEEYPRAVTMLLLAGGLFVLFDEEM